jgi:tetratricopeptide (TPR) repeat protein
MEGGTDSIRLGVPRDTDLALSTGLPTLADFSGRSAALTLAEAKQEMGRWEDSLRILDEWEHKLSGPSSQHCILLRALNERFLGYLVGSRLRDTIEVVLNIAADTSCSTSIRAKAVSISAALISSSREPHHIRQLGNISNSILTIPMDAYDYIHVLHGNAWYLAQEGGPSAALPSLLEGAALIESTGTASSIATRLLLGAGVSLCQLGRYAEAAPILSQAYAAAEKLANSALVANAAGGLALVHGRLGNPHVQIDRAVEAIRASGPEEWGICLLSAAYEHGLGLATVGRATEAESAMIEFDERFDRRRPAWVQQAWKLCKADVLALAGMERKAFSVGKVGTSGELRELHHDCFAGPYARWVAHSAVRTGTAAGALARLECHIENLERHDAKDQVEILASVAMLERSMGRDSTERRDNAEERMNALPIPTQSMIRRLGLLSDNGQAHWGIVGYQPN